MRIARKPQSWLGKHWGNIGAVSVIVFLAINIGPSLFAGLGPLNRYVVSNKLDWNAYYNGRDTEIRTNVLRGAPQTELIEC